MHLLLYVAIPNLFQLVAHRYTLASFFSEQLIQLLISWSFLGWWHTERELVDISLRLKHPWFELFVVKYVPLFDVALVQVWVDYDMLLLLLMGFISWGGLLLLHLLPNSVIFLSDISRVLVAALKLLCLDILNQLVVQP